MCREKCTLLFAQRKKLTHFSAEYEDNKDIKGIAYL